MVSAFNLQRSARTNGANVILGAIELHHILEDPLDITVHSVTLIDVVIHFKTAATVLTNVVGFFFGELRLFLIAKNLLKRVGLALYLSYAHTKQLLLFDLISLNFLLFNLDN